MADEELNADQILDLINASDDDINDKDEGLSLKPKTIRTETTRPTLKLIDDNQDIFKANEEKSNDKPNEEKSKQYNVEELFGEMSDEEFDDKPYLSEQGKSIANNLKSDSKSVSLFESNKSGQSKTFWNQKSQTKTKDDSTRDVFSGIRMINPLISSGQMAELMNGRRMVKMSLIKTALNKCTNDIDGDWVTIGVIISKVGPKVGKNGKSYAIWKLSDMKTKNVVTLFLFGEVYTEHWKLTVSTVVGVLNAKISISDQKSQYSKNEICSLTIDHPGKLLVMGKAKDIGYCRAVKKDQSICGNLINKADEDYCDYHVRTAYKKFSSKRAEIQTTFSNVEPKQSAFGQSSSTFFSNGFGDGETKDMPVIETKKYNSTKIKDLKQKEVEKLSKIVKNPISKAARNLSLSMSGSTAEKEKEKLTPISAKDVFNSIKREKSNGFTQFAVPSLAKGYKSGQMIDLSAKSDSKLRAIQLLKAKPIQPADPNAVRKDKDGANQVKKRNLSKIISKINSELEATDELEEPEEERKSKKMKSDLIELAMNRKSVNERSAEVAEMEAQDKYFSTLEKKEKMEEQLSKIVEQECDVVTCRNCKYTAHSASELCKKSGHRLIKHKATKRFFKCNNCKYRSFAFNILIPTKPCSKCGQTSYTKTSIINVSIVLQIRNLL